MTERTIHISWEGPFDLRHVPGDADHDIGLYQIYAHHPVYGRCLVYIGKTEGQTFSTRIQQEQWGGGTENDPSRVEVYVGRLMGDVASLSDWQAEINAAEKLLIHSHGPAYNTRYIIHGPAPADCADVRVVNWGACRSLAREVSGQVWTSRGVALRSQPTRRKRNLTAEATQPR